MSRRPPSRSRRSGSVLVIVLWIAFGLVSITLYFAHAMSLELRAADNRVAGAKARLTIQGAARYVSNVLAQVETAGGLPDPLDYASEAVPVGESYFWLLGRDSDETRDDLPVFGLVDEGSRINLNSASLELLESIPYMTSELAAAILDWRDEDDDLTPGGAENETYLRLNPPYECKNKAFESVEELRLVYGADLDLLYGEDTNMNGILDPNENDGNLSPPMDNRNGRLDRGILDYVTVYSRQPNSREDGSPRIDVTSPNRQELAQLLQETFGADRANEIMARLVGPPVNSVLALYQRSGMTEAEFGQIAADITHANGEEPAGLINVNTASESVLAAVPGIEEDQASALVAARRSNVTGEPSLAWVADVLQPEDIAEAGPFLTAESYQFTADIIAVGRHGRGFRRVRFVFDTSEGEPKTIYRQDLSHLGWALGGLVREQIRASLQLGRF